MVKGIFVDALELALTQDRETVSRGEEIDRICLVCEELLMSAAGLLNQSPLQVWRWGIQRRAEPELAPQGHENLVRQWNAVEQFLDCHQIAPEIGERILEEVAHGEYWLLKRAGEIPRCDLLLELRKIDLQAGRLAVWALKGWPGLGHHAEARRRRL